MHTCSSRAISMLPASLCAMACAGATAWDDTPSRKVADSSGASQPPATPESATLTASTPAPTSADVGLQDEDWSKTWRQLAAPSVSKDGALVAGAPGGWIAVSTRDQDGTKNLLPRDSFPFFSRDGTHWHAIRTPGDYALQAASVAYGGGHYVITGERNGTVVLDSTDGETWHEQSLDDSVFGFYEGPVTYAGDRFFYMSLVLWGSMDGEHWAALPHDYHFPLLDQIAYGNGVYLGVGTQTQLSSNGTEWHAAALDCALPIDCSAPDGNLYPPPVSSVFFAEGLFHIRGIPHGGPPWQLTSSDGELTSPDGESWQFVPGPAPDAYVAGRFTQFLGGQPTVWLPGESTFRPIEVVSRVPEQTSTKAPEELPADVDLSWSDGIDCTNNTRCVVIHSKLYLVP